MTLQEVIDTIDAAITILEIADDEYNLTRLDVRMAEVLQRLSEALFELRLRTW